MKYQFNIKDKKIKKMFKTKLLHMLYEYNKNFNKIIFICIGTDRSTGDSFGPLTGLFLSKAKILKKYNCEVYGTIHEPIHAKNIKQVLKNIDTTNALIIGIDASLDSLNMIEHIIIEDVPINPGSAMNKDLPCVGDISIKGVVNISSSMNFIILQNTRLSISYAMAEITAECIKYAVKKYYENK